MPPKAIQDAKAQALAQIRAARVPLVVEDGREVYLCPDCGSSGDQGFAAWHDRRSCGKEVARG